jgi:hypothetical protein
MPRMMSGRSIPTIVDAIEAVFVYINSFPIIQNNHVPDHILVTQPLALFFEGATT